jgi:hypothetical protein
MITGNSISNQAAILSFRWAMPRKAIIGAILIVALVAFEVFNFDTTRYALESLLGDVNFLGISWAVILAIAFCAIDFAGLTSIFTPESGNHGHRSTWYLMGAWLLGATMNAIMTWWAVNLTLLNHDLGNEVLSREELLRFVPLFVAVLVWLTRILFIGAFSIAGSHLFDTQSTGQRKSAPAVSTSANKNMGTPTPRGNRRPAAKPGNLPRRPRQPVPVGMQASARRR